MPKKLIDTVLATLLMSGLSGCHSTPPVKEQTSPSNPPAVQGAESTVTLSIPSQTGNDAEEETYSVQAAAGAKVEVSLPFQAGTGYSWALASHSDGLSLINTSTRSKSEDGRTGGPMEATYILRLSPGDGSDNAIFKLARPWEADASPVRTVKVDFVRKPRQR